MANWEEIKRSEKGRRSVTEGIPLGLPALMLTAKLARKARSVGLEPPGADEVGPPSAALGRLARGRGEGRARIPTTRCPLTRPVSSDAVAECLYVVANLAQRLGIDAEHALRERALHLRDDIVAAEGVPKPGRTNH